MSRTTSDSLKHPMNLKTTLEFAVEALNEEDEPPPLDKEEAQARQLYIAFTKALAGHPPAGFPESRRLAIISTVHMTEGDYQRINAEAFHGKPFIVAIGQHSVTLRVDKGGTQPDWMSGGLRFNLRTLAAMGFERVEFDGDAPVIPTLQQFNW